MLDEPPRATNANDGPDNVNNGGQPVPRDGVQPNKQREDPDHEGAVAKNHNWAVRFGRKCTAVVSAPFRESPKWTDIAIVILTLGLVIVGYWQYKDMQAAGEQTNKLIKAANIQAGAASKNAEAAQSFATSADGIKRQTEAAVHQFQTSNQTTQKALVLVQRPFVFPVPKVIAEKQEDKSVLLSVNMENSGSTPTEDLHTRVNYLPVLPTPIPPSPKTLGFCDFGLAVIAPIGPKGATPFYSNRPIPNTEFQSYRQGLYVYGWATYRDSLSPASDHITRFCYQVTVTSYDSPQLVVNQSCPYYNCYDEECKDKTLPKQCTEVPEFPSY